MWPLVCVVHLKGFCSNVATSGSSQTNDPADTEEAEDQETHQEERVCQELWHDPCLVCM